MGRCIVGYMRAMHQHEQEETAYRVYVTESLRLIPQQKCLSKGFADIIDGSDTMDVDAEEIVDDVISRAGLVVRNGPTEPSG